MTAEIPPRGNSAKPAMSGDSYELQVLGNEEEDVREVHVAQKEDGGTRCHPAVLEDTDIEQGGLGVQLPEDEADAQGEPDNERHDDGRVPPALGRSPDDPVEERAQARD
jgi:hypothetical protein